MRQATPGSAKRLGLSEWGAIDWGATAFPSQARVTVHATGFRNLRGYLEGVVERCGFRVYRDSAGRFNGPSPNAGSLSEGTVIAERPRQLPRPGPVRAWLLSPAAIGLEVLFAVFVGFLVAGLVGAWPVPIALLLVPAILTGAGLWHGYFTRAQTTGLARLAYESKPTTPATISTPTPQASGLGDVQVIVSYGSAVSHNRTQSGLRNERWLERIDPAPDGDSTLRQIVDLVQRFPQEGEG